jgi:hypothetical protein
MIVQLAYGLLRNGSRHRDAVVRPLTGADEARLTGSEHIPAERLTRILVAATERVGDLMAPTAADMRELTIWDRQRLASAIYETTFGRQLAALATCAAAHCGTVVDLELDASLLRLSVDPPSLDEPDWESSIAVGNETWRVRLRPLSGADHEMAARLAVTDAEGAAALLAERCVASAVDAAGVERSSTEVARLAREQSQQIGAILARVHPDPAPTLQIACPECGGAMNVLVDVVLFLLDAVGATADVTRDVHRLASAYHWSEADILALPISRRRRYLELVGEGGFSS